MINIIDKNEIIVRFKNGEAKRSISKSLGLARNTVKKYIDEYEHLNEKLNQESDCSIIALIQDSICSKPKSKGHFRKRMRFTAEVEKRFYELINIDEERKEIIGVNKQSLTGTLLHKTLISEGYKVSQTTILNEYKKYKDKQKECFIRQHYEYGKRAEYDFHQIKVQVGNEIKVYHQATISIPKSNYVFGLLYKNENMHTVMDSIIKFINHCGGVFEEMVFDNMSTVVKRFVLNGEKQYTDEIIKLSNYYGFKITTCNARSGNEKGHVENSGKTVRKNLFSLRYKFASEDELFNYYHSEIIKFNEKSKVEFEKEKTYLNDKPKHDYILCEFENKKVNSYSLISVRNNFYSVPDKYVGVDVIVNIFTDKIVVYYKALKICEHIKKQGFKEYCIDITHYISTFLKKPGALKNSLALKQAPEELKKLFYNDYNMNSKLFIEEALSDKPIITNKGDSIDQISANQLNYITQLFNEQGEKNESNRTTSL